MANPNTISQDALQEQELEDQPRPHPLPKDDPGQSNAKEFAIEAAQLLTDYHSSDVLVLDVRGISPITNFMVIATGTSDRQIKGVAQHVKDLSKQRDLQRYKSESDLNSKWLVEDYIDVIIHLFEPETRAHYDLEMLWGDAPKIEF